MSIIKLFCFPYAGGSSMIFNKWKPYLNAFPDIELIPVELAGRGTRMEEPLYSELQEAVEDLYQVVISKINDSQYAFFGHSLGGLLVYELAQKIRQLNMPQPVHLFFSGRCAPDIKRNKKYHLMDNDEFKLKVFKLGGTPSEFFDHPQLMELFLPVLRNDFRIAETDLSEQKLNPFDCDISVFLGRQDYEISPQVANRWKMHTKGTCVLHYFDGGHFFLHEEVAGITKLIKEYLNKAVLKENNWQG